MIAAAGAGRITAITGPTSHLFPYLGAAGAKLPGDGAPPVEPPPALKERIMAVVHAEVCAAEGRDGPLRLPASASSAAAPAAGGLVTADDGRCSLRVWGLPAPPAGAAYRVWLMHGAPPRVPEAGPRLDLDAHGGATIELHAPEAAQELAVALEGVSAGTRAAPVLRVLLPPGVAARDDR